MPERICSIEGCDKPYQARGWCQSHYARYMRHGDPLAGRAPRDSFPDTCTIEGCDGKHEARGWCKRHWLRWWKHGDPLRAVILFGDDEARFWSKVDKNGPTPPHDVELGPCWAWSDYHANGYARFWADGRIRLAYRWAYENFIAPVDLGLELDHLCANRGCVNFERHLEPVTHLENIRRRYAIRAAT